MNAIYLRSSVRQYTDEPVDIRDIEADACRYGRPSAVNQQPWEFYIARDETTRLALAASSPLRHAGQTRPLRHCGAPAHREPARAAKTPPTT